MKKILIAAAAGAAILFAGTVAFADTVGPITFETYTLGNINGQNGWTKTGSYDVNVVATGGTPASFGTQSLQISDAVTSGSFGDQTFAPPLTNAAGESDADTGGFSSGTIQPHFEAQFDIFALPSSIGDTMSVSPDRGDGARMSYLRFENQADGTHVYFDDVTDPTHTDNADTFNEEQLAVLSSGVPHTIKFSMDFYPGPDNDVVNIYIDGSLVHTGTSWEDYYLYDAESNPGFTDNHSRTVRTLIFREGGTANPSDAGKGFLIDNLSLESGPIPPAATTGCTTLTLLSGANSPEVTQTDGYTATTVTGPAMGLNGDNYSDGQDQNIGGLIPAVLTQTVIPPWVDPTASSTFAGASWVSSDKSWPGGAGNTEGSPNDDQWRLFAQGFAIPQGAIIGTSSVTYSVDNAAEVYLNSSLTPISSTGFVYGAGDTNNDPYYSDAFNAPFTPTTGYNQLSFVVRNWGSPTLSNNTNPTGLLYTATVNYCMPPTSVKVTIDKYVDGAPATAAGTNSSSFPMVSSWDAANLGGAGTGNYDLGTDDSYQAVTSAMDPGSSYSTNEVTTGNNVVGPSCTAGDPYELVGYKTGTTLANAIAAATSTATPSFTDMMSDEYVIVLNQTCPPPTLVKVHILKYLDGATSTAASANSFQFPMVSTWQTANLDGGATTSGSYVLGDNYGGAADLYGADTSAMQSPAYYTTNEVASSTSGSVLPIGAQCSAGKYELLGYTTSMSGFANAAGQTPTATVPQFTNLGGDAYVIVWNKTCSTTPPPPPVNACSNTASAPAGYTLRNGTTGNDTVTLAPFTMFVGKGGNDKVTGPAGNYIVCTGTGNDIITLGNGSDTITDTGGNNTITVGDGSSNITTGAGNDIITTGTGTNVIDAGNGNNTIKTGDGNQTVTTGSGNDTITTGGGNDSINAGNGNNTVNSGAGSDTVTTGSGNDTINGGPGINVCSAGGGVNSLTNCNP